MKKNSLKSFFIEIKTLEIFLTWNKGKQEIENITNTKVTNLILKKQMYERCPDTNRSKNEIETVRRFFESEPL